MPATVIPRGDRFAARVTIDGSTRWLGTHPTRELAELAVDAEKTRAVNAQRARSKREGAGGSRCPSERELDAILAAIPDPAFRAFCLCAAWSGLRLSEVAALAPADVIINGTDVARIKVRAGKRLPGGPPRKRTALLFEPGLSAVREIKHEVLAARHPRALLFVNEREEAWTRQTVARKFARACVLADVEGVTFHGLRKHYGTWLLNQGHTEMDVACALGHFRKDGRPHVDLVREVYGWPSVDAALERLAGR